MKSVSFRRQLEREGIELSVGLHGGTNVKNDSISETDKV